MLKKPDIHTPTVGETLTIRLLIVTGLLSVIHFCGFFFRAEYRGYPLLYAILCFVIGFGILRNLIMWYYYASISVPDTPATDRKFSVDILTTYFPGEPYAMIEETLRAIQAITYPHSTYLCDEADDPYLRKFCARLGVIHVTRDNRKNAKAGNINNALRRATGEICLILDPDHVPQPDFLDHIVPHFTDDRVGFVQTVQAYHNKFETLVARGAAQQTFHFYGPMMMTMQDYGTVNAIGANCTFRRAALDSIGGHAPGLAEDMHTAMLLYREGWKSVYVPRILARGQVPETLTAYFKQQLKWSRGTFDLFVKVYPRIFGRLNWRQRLHYALMPVHYLAGLCYLGAFLLPILSLLLSEAPWRGNFIDFALYALPLVFTSFVIRQYIQKWLLQHDERGFHIIGGILEIISWWIFTLGFLYTLINKRIPYLPTPKGGEERTHIKLLLPNLAVAVVSVAAIVIGLIRDFTPFSLLMATFALVNALFMSFSVYLAVPATNRHTALPRRTPAPVYRAASIGKSVIIRGLDLMTLSVRTLAPVLLLLVVFASVLALNARERTLASGPVPAAVGDRYTPPEVGMYYPSDFRGTTDISAVARLADSLPYPVETLSSYFNWDQTNLDELAAHLAATAAFGSTPLISWEPWMTDSSERPPYRLAHITAGVYDSLIFAYAQIMAEHDGPVLLRFAHEFNNPDYPWSVAGGNSPQDFRSAWVHLYHIFESAGAANVNWVWNPWERQGAGAYYPGADFVDYLGVTALNYGPGFSEIPTRSFAELYQPFTSLQDSLDLPVIVAEFGSLGSDRQQLEWARAAVRHMRDQHPGIERLVYFYSRFDERLPGGDRSRSNPLDWTFPNPPDILAKPPRIAYRDSATIEKRGFRALPTFRAVDYRKTDGDGPYHYLPTRSVLGADLRAMREVGIDQININDPGIYAYNLINLSEEQGLDLIYEFWISDSLNFLDDSLATRAAADRILDRIERLVDEGNIIAWHLGNDQLYTLSQRYPAPLARRQQGAYLEWLARLVEGIHGVDGRRPVLLDQHGDTRGPARLRAAGLDRWPIAGFVVRSDRKDGRDRITGPYAFLGDRLVHGGVAGADLLSLPAEARSARIILAGWQHRWSGSYSGHAGLLNFRGHRTPAYGVVADNWGSGAQVKTELPAPAILPPAIAPYYGMRAEYRALIFADDDWVRPGEATGLSYNWALIRLSPYGIPVGRKELGEGRAITLDLPYNHLDYLIELAVTDGTHVRETRRPLLPRQ